MKLVYISGKRNSSVYLELLYKYKNVKEMQKYAHICVI